MGEGIAIEDQKMPDGKGKDVGHLVVQDIESRIEKGIETYGERLTSHNGRRSIVDTYQEILDAALYLRQYIDECDFKLENNGYLPCPFCGEDFNHKGLSEVYKGIVYNRYTCTGCGVKTPDFKVMSDLQDWWNNRK